MSKHPDMRNLLGPYVMGDLEPHEKREVEKHLEGCTDCKEETRELGFAHEYLADLALATRIPPQDLEKLVVAGTPRREAGRRVRAWIAVVAAAFCVFALLAAVFVPDLSGSEALASATLSPSDHARGAGGEVRIEDTAKNTEVRLEAWGLPACERDQYYELWLVEGEERVSAGSFTVGPNGRVDIDMNAPAFALTYPTVGITAEHDKDPRASNARMLSGELHDP